MTPNTRDLKSVFVQALEQSPAWREPPTSTASAAATTSSVPGSRRCSTSISGPAPPTDRRPTWRPATRRRTGPRASPTRGRRPSRPGPRPMRARSPMGRAPGSGLTCCSRRSARAGWVPSIWPSSRIPSAARSRLKVIKPGMDTAQVVARFEAERQALAMMDHPNIARVFDAGATGSGRPYFVMELVDGVPITQYCDRGPARAARAAGAVRARSATRSSTPIRRGSSTATSSRRTSWSRRTTAGRCRR